MTADDNINILVVDDSPTNLLALESILRTPDRNLIRAGCGEEALRYLLDNEVAVVLLDVYMPGIDGLETAEFIRGREKSRDIPIIFLTANSTGVRHLSRGYSLGAVDYIVKPVEPEILRSKVAVFVELFKKTREIKRQAQLLHEKNQELENANLARLNMLIDLGHELAAEHDPEQVLAKFCRSSRGIVGAEEAAVCLLDAGATSMRHFFHCTKQKETVSVSVIPAIVQRALDRVIVEQRALRLSEADESMLADEIDYDSLHSFLGAPILSASGVSGWFYVLNKTDADDFSEADERLAATLTTQVSVAYENARLYAETESHAAELRSEMAVRKQAEEERAQLLIREQAARAEAELANRAKDEFLATLSHELRTPLSAILIWARLLRSGRLETEAKGRALEVIERNTKLQARLIEDLLEVSRIIAGKLRLELAPVDLAATVESAIDAVRAAADAKDITLECELDHGIGPVRGDRNRLQQIVWNLVANAIKFTPSGGRVAVRLARDAHDAVISVRDTGIGIPADFLPHIFERFRQADSTSTRAHGGLGLGLAIVRHLVERHGGTVTAASPGEGQGATFTVRLPVPAKDVEAGDAAWLSGLARRPGPSPLSLHGLHVLLVEDESDMRESVTVSLELCGARVTAVGAAPAALEILDRDPPDIVLCDIGMPDEDGYTLVRKIRSRGAERGGQIPAVALTAYARDEDRSRALDAGFQIHIAKPVEPTEIARVVADLCRSTTRVGRVAASRGR